MSGKGTRRTGGGPTQPDLTYPDSFAQASFHPRNGSHYPTHLSYSLSLFLLVFLALSQLFTLYLRNCQAYCVRHLHFSFYCPLLVNLFYSAGPRTTDFERTALPRPLFQAFLALPFPFPRFFVSPVLARSETNHSHSPGKLPAEPLFRRSQVRTCKTRL